LVETDDFNPPHMYLGVIPSDFFRDIWHQKTRVVGLLYGVVGDPMLAILVELRLMSDEQTDRMTNAHTTTSYTALA